MKIPLKKIFQKPAFPAKTLNSWPFVKLIISANYKIEPEVSLMPAIFGCEANFCISFGFKFIPVFKGIL